MQFALEFTMPNTPLANGDGSAVVTQELLAATEVGVALVQGSILPRVPVDRGQLRQGVQTSVVGDAQDLTGRVFDPVGHAIPMEAGAAAHWPPRDAIEGWVRRKGIATDEREVRSVAFLIARAISRRGIRARNFFKEGTEAVRGRVSAAFKSAHTRIVKRLGGNA